jgi:hypothetical protein
MFGILLVDRFESLLPLKHCILQSGRKSSIASIAPIPIREPETDPTTIDSVPRGCRSESTLRLRRTSLTSRGDAPTKLIRATRPFCSALRDQLRDQVVLLAIPVAIRAASHHWAALRFLCEPIFSCRATRIANSPVDTPSRAISASSRATLPWQQPPERE